MSVHQDCIISLLEKHNIISDYKDPHVTGSLTYYFGPNPSLKFNTPCVSEEIAFEYLRIFSLELYIHEILNEECNKDC